MIIPDDERFWSKVERRGHDECWPWTAFRTSSGYGMVRCGPRMELSHRVASAFDEGTDPGDLHVIHSCDNPPCCNPAHLRRGTNADNIADKVARGRSHAPQPKKRGERHPLAKLTQAQVNEIREHTGMRGHGRRLAKKFGVSPATVCAIQKGRIWQTSPS